MSEELSSPLAWKPPQVTEVLSPSRLKSALKLHQQKLQQKREQQQGQQEQHKQQAQQQPLQNTDSSKMLPSPTAPLVTAVSSLPSAINNGRNLGSAFNNAAAVPHIAAAGAITSHSSDKSDSESVDSGMDIDGDTAGGGQTQNGATAAAIRRAAADVDTPRMSSSVETYLMCENSQFEQHPEQQRAHGSSLSTPSSSSSTSTTSSSSSSSFRSSPSAAAGPVPSPAVMALRHMLLQEDQDETSSSLGRSYAIRFSADPIRESLLIFVQVVYVNINISPVFTILFYIIMPSQLIF